MHATPNFASIGALLGDPTRAAMLEALYDGRAWTAGELAQAANVTPQTASAHLQKLVQANLLAVAAQGRHRYFRLASSDVADALEALSILATRRLVRPWLRSGAEPLHHARTCYDHLAGTLGVSLVESLLRQRCLTEGDDAYSVTPAGRALLRRLDIDVEAARSRRRSFARKCLDWSERRYHLGGALGAALAECLFARKWLRQAAGSRAVSVTPLGERGFRELNLLQE